MSVIPIDTARSPLSYALRYAAKGMYVFPCWWIAEDGKCACRSDKCEKSPGKHPIPMLTPKGQNNATTDPAVIKRWWQQMPKANVAVALAQTGWVAIDIDPRNGGYATIERIEAEHGALESDVLQYSGGGGEHRVFLAPADIGSMPGSLGPGVDVKHNGYIIAEPSNHISGKHYAWEASSDPLEGAIPSPLPDWLRNLSTQKLEAAAAQSFIRPISAAEFADCLAALPAIPNDDREVWLHVGFALHSTGYEQAAFDAWDAWSRTSTKYDPVDQTRVWRSFRAKGIAGVTKATIFALAMQHGWVNAPALPAPVPIETLPVVERSAPVLPRPKIRRATMRRFLFEGWTSCPCCHPVGLAANADGHPQTPVPGRQRVHPGSFRSHPYPQDAASIVTVNAEYITQAARSPQVFRHKEKRTCT